MTPNKSLDIKFPVLNDGLYGHFIRGYFSRAVGGRSGRGIIGKDEVYALEKKAILQA